jgi:lambda family phage minor tail protein L
MSTINDATRAELASLEPTSIIELFELKTETQLHGVCEIYRFHAGVNAKQISGPVYWRNRPYTPWPVEAEGFEYDGKGALPRPKVRIANLPIEGSEVGSISAILLEINASFPGSDLAGARVTRIRTLARFLDPQNFPGNVNPWGPGDPSCELPREVYFIDRKSAETRELVEFELCAVFDLAGVRAPKRQCIRNACQWRYRSTECGYGGTSYWDEADQPVGTLEQDQCGKRLSSCKLRFGELGDLPFGSFPGVGQVFGV